MYVSLCVYVILDEMGDGMPIHFRGYMYVDLVKGHAINGIQWDYN